MCRIVVFTGTCTQCSGTFIWDDLSQELSCLEAKNVGQFGQCRRGVAKEEHVYDQECEQCAAENKADEGVGGMEEEEEEADNDKPYDPWAALDDMKNQSDKSKKGKEVDGQRTNKKQRTS
ncbi:hypothetical protein QBC46DRAFT_409774 [Diplogelasinospora grovesii]|uniref:Uncharacterized protein n=1 Tax=Diplogelasinospora grovesii TaxID=303347 RepID=A0AAN6N459_9PEZI|nr:hypothetical protein QBC46DRAFT_409774 [Diplogelasinospora grovesii]